MKNPSKKSIKILSKKWYSRDDVANFIYDFMYKYNRETMGFAVEGYVSRPLDISDPRDIIDSAGIISSYHASIERYKEDPNFKNELPPLEGWDLVIDIDCKPLNTNKIKFEAWELAKYLTMEFVGFTVFTFYEENIYVKYSGNRGFHIIIPWESLPKEVLGYSLVDYKEELYKTVLIFIRDILECMYENLLNYYKESPTKYPFSSYVDVDLQVASPRHMMRVPYSLNEKTGLVSVIIPNKELDKFHPEEHAVTTIDEIYVPKIRNQKNPYMYDFFVYALLYRLYHFVAASEDQRTRYVRLLYGSYKNKTNISIENEEDLYPPCIRNILEGLEDGRKRSLFVLVNFFRLIGKPADKTMQLLQEWNKKNKDPLKDRLLEYAVDYHYTRNKYRPYSCQRMKEELGELNICKPDELCPLIRNPVSYFFKKKNMVCKNARDDKVKSKQ